MRRERPRSPLIGLALWLATAAALAVAGAALFASADHRLDLIAQFTGPAVAATTLAALAGAAAFRPRLAGVLLAALGLQLWAMQPQLRPAAPDPAPGEPLKVYFANLWYRNPDPAQAATSIVAEDPDVIALIEVGPRHLRALERTLRPYPHRLNAVTGVYQGRAPRIMIASRYPLSRLASERRDGLAVTEALVAAPGGDIRLVVTHLTRPWPFDDPEAQTRQARRLARRLAAGDTGRLLLVGDFNAVAAGALLRRFAGETGLTPLAAATGTWPAGAPAPFRLAIDNALAGSELSLSARRVAGPTGSDHRPIAFQVWTSQASARLALRRLRGAAAGAASSPGSTSSGAVSTTNGSPGP